MRELQPWTDAEALDGAFDDIAAAAGRLPVRRLHAHHRARLRRARTGRRRRHSRPTAWRSYRKLLRELAFEERKHDKAASANVKRRWKQIHKAQREMYKLRN